MNDYSKILVKDIFTLLENISELFLQFCTISPNKSRVRMGLSILGKGQACIDQPQNGEI